MAEQDPEEVATAAARNVSQALALVMLKVIDAGGVWAGLLVVAMLTGAVNRFLDIVQQLLKDSVWHFWAFIAATVLAFLLAALGRRQTRTIRWQAQRIRQLAADNELLQKEIGVVQAPLAPILPYSDKK